MKKILSVFLLVTIVTTLFADEGMWVPMFLKKYTIEQMQAKGFKLTAEDIYDINHASIKDAVMIFGGGCTAELISPEGLLITNHHCGYSYIVKHSSVEHDYLTNGFWAYSKSEELPNPGLKVRFLEYMEDMTTRILGHIPENVSQTRRTEMVDSISKVITDSVASLYNENYEISVEPFFKGNQYLLVVYKIYKDVRLVAAPPSAIGKFGGETDNWMWPRHTGDFSMFRVYADKNNEPAEYSPDNIPYRPKKFLKISLKGVKEGDFTMILGFPGYTDEYAPSYRVALTTDVINPAKIKLRGLQINALNSLMQEDIKYRLMYATRVARLANGWKKWIGENKGLHRLQAVKKKKQQEQKFIQWTQTTEQGAKYKGLMEEYKSVYKQSIPYEKAYTYYKEAIFYQPLYDYITALSKKMGYLLLISDEQEFNAKKDEITRLVDNFFAKHEMETEKYIYGKLMFYLQNDLDDKFVPEILKTYFSDSNGDAKLFASKVFDNSISLNKDLFIEKINSLKIGKHKQTKKFVEEFLSDPVYQIYAALQVDYMMYFVPYFREKQPVIDSLDRLYMQALMQWQPDKHFYPDANFTMRVSYGEVKGYKPRDAVYYDYYTTLDGIIEKDDPTVYDYKVPRKLKDLYYKKDFGQYAADDGKIHVCFIANNHTTGGNSGSPVLDAQGNLIGVNFDRTWESTMSDYYYSPERCRNISLDIRYVLFLLDKYAGAKNLINEMEFVK